VSLASLTPDQASVAPLKVKPADVKAPGEEGRKKK
jgi:hypothetical protein